MTADGNVSMKHVFLFDWSVKRKSNVPMDPMRVWGVIYIQVFISFEVSYYHHISFPEQNTNFTANRQNICPILETKCTSWHGYEYEKSCTSNNRCFNQISFNESRDCADSIWIECQRLEDWKSPKLNNKKAFHCASGDCIPKTEVCDGIKNCEDGSDEIEGCEAIQGNYYLQLIFKNGVYY